MLNNQTLDQLDALGLFGMALGLREQLEQSQYLSLSFDERFGLIVYRSKTAPRDVSLPTYLPSAPSDDPMTLSPLTVVQR